MILLHSILLLTRPDLPWYQGTLVDRVLVLLEFSINISRTEFSGVEGWGEQSPGKKLNGEGTHVKHTSQQVMIFYNTYPYRQEPILYKVGLEWKGGDGVRFGWSSFPPALLAVKAHTRYSKSECQSWHSFAYYHP